MSIKNLARVDVNLPNLVLSKLWNNSFYIRAPTVRRPARREVTHLRNTASLQLNTVHMGRSNRGRSGSISSDICTKTCSNTPLPGAIEAASFLFQLALTLHSIEYEEDQNVSSATCSDRTNFLHKLMRHRPSAEDSNEDIRLIDTFLQRASYLDSCNSSRSSPLQHPSLLTQTLLQQDRESGYSPLHEASIGRNLLAILLMLRYSSLRTLAPYPAPMMDTRWPLIHPMKLLDPSQYSSPQSTDNLLSNMMSLKDKEGLTPLQLLCRCFVSDFTKCRNLLSSWLDNSIQLVDGESGEGSSGFTESTSRGRSRSLSFHNLHPDHELEESSLDSSRDHESSNNTEYTYGCEIMTFGKPDHCALGTPQGTTSDRCRDSGLNGLFPSSVRPKRVETFALGEMGRDFTPTTNIDGSEINTAQSGPAIAVAAGTYHSLVVTQKGHLFAFGLGKGGRLGTGNENHCPLPVRIMGPLERRHVVAVSAATNHSLCVTKDGDVYSWGQNGFGQLGIPKTGQTNATMEQKFLPRRVEALRQSFILAVAAGERHSMALSRGGEVYVWGDNRNGQLGVAAPTDSSNTGRDIYLPTRLNSLLVHGSHRRFAIAIAASEFSSLVLTRPYAPNTASSKINSVFEFGHGNHFPTIVVFPSYDESVPRLNQDIPRSYVTSMKTNPVAIACAKYHNVAITDDGRVYTWGLHSCDLGTSTSFVPSQTRPRRPSIGSEGEWEENCIKGKSGNAKRVSSAGTLSLASPQLVKGMLPEGGGRAVQVAASENHTCVITDTGNLFTWGAAYGNEVLGHDGVKYVSTPLKVPGVHRAIGLASAKEHTLLMLCTKLPSLPKPLARDGAVPKLQDLVARKIAAHIDMFNVVPILNFAERIRSFLLMDFCDSFVRCNLDGILSVGRKSEFESYLNEVLSGRAPRLNEYDEKLHPLLHALVRLKESDVSGKSKNWVNDCIPLAKSLPAAALQNTHNGSPSAHCATWPLPTQKNVLSKTPEASERAIKIISSPNSDSSTNLESAQSALDNISKEVRTIRKKLAQISELENFVNIDAKSLTAEQLDKVGRRPSLEADLNLLEPRLLELISKVKLFESLRDRGVTVKNSVSEHQTMNDSHLTDNALHAQQTLLCKIDDNNSRGPKSHPCGEEDISMRYKESAANEQNSVTGTHKSTKFFCSVCSISCPDDRSYELHLNGRKHFNTLRHMQKNTRVNLCKLTDSSVDHNATDSNNLTGAWGKTTGLSVTPRYNLPPPPRTPSEISIQPSSVKAPLIPSFDQVFTPKKSFRQIMEEEERKASRQHVSSVKSSKDQGKTKKSPTPLNSDSRHPSHFWATTIESPSHATKLTDTASLAQGLAQLHSHTHSSVWAKPDSSTLSEDVAMRSLKKSIYDIQQDEINYKEKEDKGIIEGKWYVGRRERAPSISAIQQEESEAQQLLTLIEEQRQIEEQIMRDRKKDGTKSVKADTKHMRGKNRSKQGEKQSREGIQMKNDK